MGLGDISVRHADGRSQLAIYLQDHLAGAVVGVQLARRAFGNNRGTPLEPVLRDLANEIGEDKRVLERIVDALGFSPSLPKSVLALVAERLGRGKLNGQLVGYSPLSRLVELEGLGAGVEEKLNLWRVLQDTLPTGALPADIDLDAMIARGTAQRATIEHHRREAAREAFTGAVSVGI